MGRLYPGNTLFFNNTELTAIPGLIIESIGVSDPPNRIIESYKRARTHGRAVVAGFNDDRPIIVKGKFAANSQVQFEQARDTLLAAIYTLQGVLRTDVSGAPRLFNCTLDRPKIPEHMGGFAEVELDFNAYDPFGYDLGYTTPASTTTTLPNKDFSITFGGSASRQYPLITLTVTSVTGSTTSSILSITNRTTGQTTTITGLVTTGDVFTIDTEQGKVFKNGVAISFGGALPYAAPGLVWFSYADTGLTTRNVSIQPLYRKRYA
jgi:hypothetical protein